MKKLIALLLGAITLLSALGIGIYYIIAYYKIQNNYRTCFSSYVKLVFELEEIRSDSVQNMDNLEKCNKLFIDTMTAFYQYLEFMEDKHTCVINPSSNGDVYVLCPNYAENTLEHRFKCVEW